MQGVVNGNIYFEPLQTYFTLSFVNLGLLLLSISEVANPQLFLPSAVKPYMYLNLEFSFVAQSGF